jgi:hypothetical protein
MGLRALERRLVLLRAFLAVREEVDRYLDLAKRRRSLPNPVELKEAIRNRGLDPPGLLKGRDYLWECGKKGVTPDRDELVCMILGMEDRWLVKAIEDSTPAEFGKGPTKAQRSAILAQGKQMLREFKRERDEGKRSLLAKVREARAQAKATAASGKADGVQLIDESG